MTTWMHAHDARGNVWNGESCPLLDYPTHAPKQEEWQSRPVRQFAPNHEKAFLGLGGLWAWSLRVNSIMLR